MNKYSAKNIDEFLELDGGVGDDLDISNIPAKEIQKGVDIEHEHTPNVNLALDIVKDHEQESIDMTGEPEYYKYLEDMENKMKEDGKVGTATNSIEPLSGNGVNDGYYKNPDNTSGVSPAKQIYTPDPYSSGHNRQKNNQEGTKNQDINLIVQEKPLIKKKDKDKDSCEKIKKKN